MPVYTSSRPALPNLAAGAYFAPSGTSSLSSTNAIGSNIGRFHPWIVERPLQIDRIGAEVVPVGEAGSKYRLGVYADNGFSYPGALVLDAGQIAGDSATVQELTCSVTFSPGVYWVGGATQSAPTTQPVIRTLGTLITPVFIGMAFPGANQAVMGYGATMSGALPATYPAAQGPVFGIPRVFMRSA
jgi:hypothetical protein